MVPRVQAKRARQALDRRVAGLQNNQGLARPAGGWIRAVREALGMSADQLARRLGTTRQAVSSLESAELHGGIKLTSLRRAAEAMNCELVYAFVPNTTLDDAVREQARRVVSAELARVDQTMLLEAQRVEGAAAADLLNDRAAAVIDSRRLWDDDRRGK